MSKSLMPFRMAELRNSHAKNSPDLPSLFSWHPATDLCFPASPIRISPPYATGGKVKPVSLRALDIKPGSEDMVVGTEVRAWANARKSLSSSFCAQLGCLHLMVLLCACRAVISGR